MEAEDGVLQRLAVELQSYVPVILVTLAVYVVESDASLKLWHAVRQLPHLEKEPTTGDCESNVDETHLEKIRATRAAIKKEARKKRIGQLILVLIAVVIFYVNQFVMFSRWINWARKGQEFDGYVGNGTGDEDAQREYGFGWFYLTKFGQIDWTELCYPALLFLPAVILLSKFFNLVTGLKEKVVFRDTRGVPFLLFQRESRPVPHHLASLRLCIILASASLAMGALFLRYRICVILVFVSIAHYTISGSNPGRLISIKASCIWGLCLLAVLVSFGYILYLAPTSTDGTKILKFVLLHDASDVDWPVLVMGSWFCIMTFHYVATCYRMDHSFARPDELLVGKPDVKLNASGSDNPEESSLIDAHGTRIPYRNRGSHPRSRWPKPYFHASLLCWLASIALIALAKVQGYIECNAEVSNFYATFFAPPIISGGILICALARGELGRVWKYKEDWPGAPKSACADAAEDVTAQVKAEVLIGVDEKVLPA